MRKHIGMTCLAALALLQGCTSLNAVKVKDGKMLAEGAPYNLTFTQYELTVNRRLTGCFEEVDDPKNAGQKILVPNMKVSTTVEGARKEARDPTQEYVIDFAKLRSFFKTTDVAVEYYDSGALKSVNATVADKTGDFLKGTFTAAAKIAMLGTGVGGAGKLPDACIPAVNDMVNSADAAEKAVAAKTAALTRATEQLEKLHSVAVALGPTTDAAERRVFAEQVKALFQAKYELEREQKILAELLKKLTFTSKETWPKDGSVRSGMLLAPLTRDDIKNWGTLSDEGLAKLEAETGVWLNLDAQSAMAQRALCKDTECKQTTSSEKLTGLKYRVALPGTLTACSNQKCEGANAKLFTDPGMFSQLGPIMTLPLRNYPFMTQTVVMTMNEAGQPTKLGYKSEAGIDKAMESVNSLVDEYSKVREAKKPKSEEDRMKAETSLLETQAKLAAAKKALEPNPYAAKIAAAEALKVDITLAEAELAKLKADAALEEAKKKDGS